MSTPTGNPGIPNPSGAYGPLRQAVRAQDWAKVLDLIDNHGADPNQKLGTNRRTLAQHAAYKGALDTLKQLHARGAQLEGIHDQHGMDVIHSAVKGTKYEVVEWLAGQGVNLDACAKKDGTPVRHTPYGPSSQFSTPRKTPLQMALKSNTQRMAQLLMDKGASPDARDNDGNTALMDVVQATLSRATRVSANLLLAYGADMDAVNNEGETAIQLSMRASAYKGHMELLADAGAQMENPAAEKTLAEYVATSSYSDRRPVEEFLQQRMDMPQLDLSQPFTKADIFAANASGYAPLDNRETWAQIGEVMDKLAAQGEPLTKTDLLQKNAQGKPWFHRAIDCRAYNRLADALAKQGTPMQGADFADNTNSRSQLSDLGLYAEDACLGRTDFSDKAHWQNKGVEAFSAFCKTLPSVLLEQIPNRFRIVQSLREDAAQGQARGR